MAWFDKKRREKTHRVEANLFYGDVDLEVVGESHYQPTLTKVQEAVGVGGDVICSIVPEPTNRHDHNAVRVAETTTGDTVGYLPREIAKAMQPKIQRLMRQDDKFVA